LKLRTFYRVDEMHIPWKESAAGTVLSPHLQYILSSSPLSFRRAGGAASYIRLSEGIRQSGMEFPNVPSKVISVVQGDPVVLKLALVTTELGFRAARRANMDVSVADQPEAATLAVGSLVRFTGTLAGYDRTPLMLHWQKAKINPQDVPPATNK